MSVFSGWTGGKVTQRNVEFLEIALDQVVNDLTLIFHSLSFYYDFRTVARL
jgi:hypothetical protein